MQASARKPSLLLLDGSLAFCQPLLISSKAILERRDGQLLPAVYTFVAAASVDATAARLTLFRGRSQTRCAVCRRSWSARTSSCCRRCTTLWRQPLTRLQSSWATSPCPEPWCRLLPPLWVAFLVSLLSAVSSPQTVCALLGLQQAAWIASRLLAAAVQPLPAVCMGCSRLHSSGNC